MTVHLIWVKQFRTKVSKWETGHGFPDVSVLSALADILGVSERALLGGASLSGAGCGSAFP